MTTQPKIFLSVGKASRPEQEEFISAMESFIDSKGLQHLTVGRNYFSSQQPLKTIDEVLRQCAGTIILAFERLHLVNAVEKRGSPNEKALSEMNLPTVWNQIEGTMAYVARQPLLVIVENGIKTEGLLETGYDWYVKWVNLEPRTFMEKEFLGIFEDWKNRVIQFANEHPAGTPAVAPAGKTNISLLATDIDAHFSKDELILLCSALGDDFERITTDSTKPVQSLEVAKYFERLGRVMALIDQLYAERPGVRWLKTYAAKQ